MASLGGAWEWDNILGLFGYCGGGTKVGLREDTTGFLSLHGILLGRSSRVWEIEAFWQVVIVVEVANWQMGN